MDCTGVMCHRKAWRKILQRVGTCQSILDGIFHFPIVPGGVEHAQSDNLSSIKEDMHLLFRIISKYLISGALEL